ncbi:protein DMP4 [Humulus lupulus]|uniref:protein DMP4 n=1 Tax=Humulus lupulus TaxID=3486 RepID=UPI002B4140D2|nr:protein DMP4 [Humulus lupulus]
MAEATAAALVPLNQGSVDRPVRRTLASAANLANLLPTGTVLTFQIFSPCFSNNGLCNLSNKYLTACLIVVCAFFCFLSSFTDSFVDEGGKLRYGMATLRGFYVFNCDYEEEQYEMKNNDQLEKYKLRLIDLVHGFVSLVLFLVFAVSDSNVKNCYFSEAGSDWNALIMNLPIGAGALSGFLFTIFPTTRRGIGYADVTHRA